MTKGPLDPADAAPALDETEQEEVLRREKKERRLQDEASRPLDPWLRYRAQIDLIKEHLDIIDVMDTRVRFGLIIIGAVNTGLAILATRSDALRSVRQPYHAFFAACLGALVLLALYLFLLAVEALRPRPLFGPAGQPMADSQNRHLGLRLPWDILARDLASYSASWDETRIGEINAELTIQCYGLARVITEKFELVGRLYRGLKIQIVLWAIFVVALGAVQQWVRGDL